MTNVTQRLAARLALACAASAIIAAHAQAQEIAGQAVELQTVVVSGSGNGAGGVVEGYRPANSGTATLTDTPLRDVPQTVNVVGREEIQDRQITQVSEALEAVPTAIKYGTSANRSENFILRGFRVGGYSIDGMKLNAAADRPELMMDLGNVERVEVLKGPGSVLYGALEPGGMINIVTRRPDAEPGIEGYFSGGSFETYRGEISATGALNADNTLRARITGAAQDSAGWIDGRPGSDRQYLGGIIEWDPTDRTRVSASLEHTRTKQPFDRGLVWVPDLGEVLKPYDSWLGETWSMVEADKTRGLIKAEHDVTDNLTLRTAFGFDFGYSYDTGIDHQGLRDDNRTLRRRYTQRVEDTDTQDWRIEALWNVHTGQIEHDVLAGYQFTRSRMQFESARAGIDDIDIFNPVHGAIRPVATPNSLYDEHVYSHSLYVQDQVTLSEQWKLLAGLRWDDFSMEREAQIGDSTPKHSDSALTGRFGVVYQPRDDLSLYASWAQSFKPQTGINQNGGALDPEEGEQFEVGAKWDVIPDQLSTTLSVFQITKTNVAVSDPNDPDADYSLQTGEQRSRGVELEVMGEVLPGWNIHAGAGYVDARVTKDTNDFVGNRLNGVPYFSGRIWSTYTVQTGFAEGLTVGGGLTHVGSRKGDLEGNFEVGGYNRLDAMARYRFQNGAELALAVNNITDERYIVSTQSEREITAGAPRNAQLRLGWSF